jgi:hypothetical protein
MTRRLEGSLFLPLLDTAGGDGITMERNDIGCNELPYFAPIIDIHCRIWYVLTWVGGLFCVRMVPAAAVLTI